MRALLLRHWFLLLLATTLVLSWLFPDWVRPLSDRLAPQVVVAGSLFLMAWGLDSHRLFRAVRRPGAALWALFVGYGATPLLAWLLGRLGTNADLTFGLILMASVPCTLASAVLWTRMAGGDDAIALLAVLLLTGTSWLFTALSLGLASSASVHLPMASMMTGLLLVLVAPVLCGQLIRTIPGVANVVDRHRELNAVLVRLLILAIIVKAALDLPRQIAGLGPLTLFLTACQCAVLHVTALSLAFWGGCVVGLDRPGCIAAAFAGSQKTLPVALYLFETYFKTSYPLAVVSLVLYHVGQLVIDTVIADAMLRRGNVPGETLEAMARTLKTNDSSPEPQ